MSSLLKLIAATILVANVTACAVVPPQVVYTGPRVEVVAVRPAPYYGYSDAYRYEPRRDYGHWGGHWGHRHDD